MSDINIKEISIHLILKNNTFSYSAKSAILALYKEIGLCTFDEEKRILKIECINYSYFDKRFLNNICQSRSFKSLCIRDIKDSLIQELENRYTSNIDILKAYGIEPKDGSPHICIVDTDNNKFISESPVLNFELSGYSYSCSGFIDYVNVFIDLKKVEPILISELLEYLDDTYNDYNNFYKLLELVANNYYNYVEHSYKGRNYFFKFCKELNPTKFKYNEKFDQNKGEVSIRNLKSFLNNKLNKKSRHSRFNNDNDFKEDVIYVEYSYNQIKQIVKDIVYQIFIPILYWYHFKKKIEGLNLLEYEHIYDIVKIKE